MKGCQFLPLVLDCRIYKANLFLNLTLRLQDSTNFFNSLNCFKQLQGKGWAAGKSYTKWKWREGNAQHTNKCERTGWLWKQWSIREKRVVTVWKKYKLFQNIRGEAGHGWKNICFYRKILPVWCRYIDRNLIRNGYSKLRRTCEWQRPVRTKGERSFGSFAKYWSLSK